MSASPNIILIGFMASGKSRIGQVLAHKLGFKLVDIDHTIEQSQGQKISEIFDNYGEAHFRGLELEALQGLQGSKNCVIVTGGGTPMSFASARELKGLGMIFFLDASLDHISSRLSRSAKRPLGAAQTPAELARVRDLFYYRRPTYLALGQPIDVRHEDQERTAQEIIERFSAAQSLAELSSLAVADPHNPYDIFLGDNALGSIRHVVASLGLSQHQPVLITSEHVAQKIGPEFSLIAKNFDNHPLTILIKDGEQHKNWASVQYIHDQLFKHACTRNTLVIALGGGTVGDVAGFAASIYMRGLPVIQVPTTLLAMVDSSVGGKTGVDTVQGKNLLGSFYPPRAVLIHTGFLNTLPPEEYACGMAEIIKHAIIGDAELFRELLTGELVPLDMISRAVMVKVKIVVSDPRESTIRAHLNLGHTFAHAIEKVSDYRIKHGQAVAIGLVFATRLAHRLGLLEEDFLPELLSVLKKCALPTDAPNLDRTALIQAMKHDKKRDSRGHRFILPKKIGEVVIQSVEAADIFG